MIVKKITDRQQKQLLKIIPSKDWQIEYRPCQVTLKNGQRFDNVYIQEEQSYIRTWGVMPDADSGKMYILIEDVIEIKESPHRLQPELANKIYEAGESGMGYCFYKLILDNGQTVDVCSGNAVDFVPLPEGLTTKNIKNVLPHEGSRSMFTYTPKYYWCLFKGDIPKTYSETTDQTTADSRLPKAKRTWWQKLWGSK